MPQRPLITACVLAAVALAFYTFRLTSTPLSAEESVFAQQAQHAFATHPPVFHVADDRWLQPAAVYAAAAIRTAQGGDYSGRIASAIIGALDVALVFAAMTLVAPYRFAIIAGLVLLATPAHFWFARLGTDAIFPVPFVLGWLIAALRFAHFDSRRALLAAGLVLGAGIYTHPTAPLVMAWLLVALVVASIAGKRSILASAPIAIGAFVAMLAPLAAWFWMHPGTYGDTYGRWAIFAAHARFPLDGLRAQVNWNTLSNRTTILWGLLDPSLLFFPATAKTIAPFLLISAITVPLGFLRVLTVLAAERAVVIAAAVVPPLVASSFGQPQDLGLVVAMSASAAVLTAYGFASLAQRHRWWIWLTGAAAVASIYQLIAL